MSEKEVMDYKKQRIGEPSTVTSLSIKGSQTSLNEDSDNETIGPICKKRKYKFTQQSFNGPVLEKDEDIYMEDIDDIDNSIGDYLNEQNDDCFSDGYLSLQNDDFLSVQNDDIDNNEDFFDIEFADIDEKGKPISVNSSYTVPPSESISESLVNETPSHSINRQEGSTGINSDNSVNSEVIDARRELSKDTSLSVANYNILSSDTMPNIVDMYENTRFIDLISHDEDSEDEKLASIVEMSSDSLDIFKTITTADQTHQEVEEVSPIEDNDELSLINISYDVHSPDSTSTNYSIIAFETQNSVNEDENNQAEDSSDIFTSSCFTRSSSSPPDSPIVSVSGSVTHENPEADENEDVEGLENLSHPILSQIIHDESNEINELDDSSDNESTIDQDDYDELNDSEDTVDRDNRGDRTDMTNLSVQEDSHMAELVDQDNLHFSPILRDVTNDLYTERDDTESSDECDMLETSDQESQTEELILMDLNSRVCSPRDEVEIFNGGDVVGEYCEDDEEFECTLKCMNDRVYSPQHEEESSHDYNMTEVVDRDENNTEILLNVLNSSPRQLNIELENAALPEIGNGNLDQNIDKDNEGIELLLVRMNKTVYSSDNESEYSIDTEMSEAIDINIPEAIDAKMSETINTEVPEMLDNEMSEVTDEQDCIDTEQLLLAMNTQAYSDDLSKAVEDEMHTDHNLDENTPGELIITGFEMDTEQFTNIFSREPYSVNENGVGNDVRSSPGPIQKIVEEMMEKSNAEIMASVDRLIDETRTTIRTNNNSSISGGSLSVDFESITHINQVGKVDNVNGYLARDELLLVASKNFEHQSSMRMWWYDAYESYEGFLYLFGKVFDKSLNAYVSCCVIVENIQREIYILPRKYQVDENGEPTGQPVAINDVKVELKKLLNINNVRNYHMETCQRKYAFNRSGVPREAEYIKLNYPYTDYRFPQEAMGSTFSNMFGSTVSPLEGFLIQKKIMGPCWLEFNNLKTSQGNSWCLFETRIESPNNCLVVESDKEKLETPPLNTLALSIQTKFNYSTKNTEIITISGFYCKNANINGQDTTTLSPFERFSVTRPISSLSPSSQRTVINPEVDFTITQEISEELMLYTFLAKLQTFDPDIIIGHEFSTIGLSILLRRMKSLKIKGWSRIGRRRLITWPKSLSESFDMDTTTYQEKLAICGRLVCDTFLASQDLVSCKSYSLQDMALSELGMPRKEITSEMMDTFEEQGIISTELARYVSFDAYLTMSIAVKLKILPLTLQLSNLAGNLWARCMYGARSERNEYLLLHSFYNEGYICPDRPAWKAKFKEPLFIDENLQLDCSRKEKDKTNPASYVGGLVLDPKAGLYDDYVLLLDFNSLYPSIIQEYNVCFTTMKQDSIDSVDYNAQGIPSTPSPDVTEGILPKLVGIFVNRRKQVKNLMKNPHLSTNAMSQYNIEQMALKLTANSMYGCLGSPTSRFYARQLAMYITSKGRNILRSAVDTTEQLGYDVIYGDTDSIMVNTQTNMFTEAKQISEKVKGVVNQKYKLLEIGVDGYFKRTLLLKKKKYAMLSVKEGPDGVELTETVEVKGLDLVRRDWCDLSRTVSENVLTKILFDKKSFDIHEYLRNISEKIYNAEYSVDDFIIRKQLNKPLEEYNNEKTLDHVSVAKDMRRARKPVKAGDVIAYIMCKSDVPSDGNTKACIPEEVKNGNAKINIEWYICKQILPPILRLCVVIDDINMDTISRCFGLDEQRVHEIVASF